MHAVIGRSLFAFAFLLTAHGTSSQCVLANKRVKKRNQSNSSNTIKHRQLLRSERTLQTKALVLAKQSRYSKISRQQKNEIRSSFLREATLLHPELTQATLEQWLTFPNKGEKYKFQIETADDGRVRIEHSRGVTRIAIEIKRGNEIVSFQKKIIRQGEQTIVLESFGGKSGRHSFAKSGKPQLYDYTYDPVFDGRL